MRKLDPQDRKRIVTTIAGIANGDEHIRAQTHTLRPPLQDWRSTKASRGHRIIHTNLDDGSLHIGYVGLHEYGDAERRLGAVEPQPLNRDEYDEHIHSTLGPDPEEAEKQPHPKSGWPINVGVRRVLDHGTVPSGKGNHELPMLPAMMKVIDHGPDPVTAMSREYNYGQGKVIGHEPPEFAYRGMSMDEYHQAKQRGYIQSDRRGVITDLEGTNAAVDPRSAVSYLPRGHGMVVKIKAKPEHQWQMIRPDNYLRTHERIPMSDVVHAEPFSKSDEWRVYKGHVPEHLLRDQRKRGGMVVRRCPCGTSVKYDPTDGWQHADGSVDHDGVYYGNTVSELMSSAHDWGANFPQITTTGGRRGDLPEGLQFTYAPGGITERNGYREITQHVVRAIADQRAVGNLYLDGRPDPDGKHRISAIDVHPDYRRRGVATAMFRHAEDLGLKPRHEDMGVITPAGRAWARVTPEGAGRWRPPAKEPQDPGDQLSLFGKLGAEPVPMQVNAALSATGSRDDDYRGQHGAPGPEDAPLHDLTQNFPEDLYTHPHFYDDGTPGWHDAHRKIVQARGKPDSKVWIYRAMPSEHVHQGIRPGDWVSISKDYARQHAVQSDDPQQDWPVIRARVPAKHLNTAGDFTEWGYNGPELPATAHSIAFKGGRMHEVRQHADGVVRKVVRRPRTPVSGYTFVHHPDYLADEPRGRVEAYSPDESYAGHISYGSWGEEVHVDPEHQHLADELERRMRMKLPKRQGALSDEDRVSVAEEAMERGGLAGRTWHVPDMRHDDPARAEAHKPVHDFINGVLVEHGHPGGVRVSPRHWDLRRPGSGQAFYDRVYNTIGLKGEQVNDMTLLHEIAHALTGTREGRGGHGPEFQQAAARLYHQHLGPEASETFRSIVSQPGIRQEAVFTGQRSAAVSSDEILQVGHNPHDPWIKKDRDQLIWMRPFEVTRHAAPRPDKDVEFLADSMRQHGWNTERGERYMHSRGQFPEEQHPITLWHEDQGSYVEPGNHRAWAAERAGLEKIPVLVKDRRTKTARKTPSQRIFGPTYGFDHRLWTEDGTLKPDVRRYVLASIAKMWGGRYQQWSDWAKVYFAGSEASEWTGPNLEGNGDFDVLVGVDYAKFRRANPAYAHKSNAAITAEMNQGFRPFNGMTTITIEGVETGPWDRTTFVNPNSYDIRRIRPYAAYDVTADEWAVKPPHLPDWSTASLPEVVLVALRAAEAYARDILKLPEPQRTQQGAALFEAWHSDRSRAFGPKGEGWYDFANLREKWLDQQGVWKKLVDCAHRAKQGLDVSPNEWSNEPRFVYHVLSGDAERDHAAILSHAKLTKKAHTGYSRHDVHRLHDIINNGGFTVHPHDRSVPQTGFSASLHPDLGGIGAVHHISELTPRHIAEHRRAGRDLYEHGLDGKKVYQGAWHDTETGDVYLDTSHISDDEGSVRDFALKHRQLAYYDLAKGHSVYFDPTRDEDYHAGKPEAIAKYHDIAQRFGEVTPSRYKVYEHEYDPHPYAAEHEKAEQTRATAARAAMRIRSLWPIEAAMDPRDTIHRGFIATPSRGWDRDAAVRIGEGRGRHVTAGRNGDLPEDLYYEHRTNRHTGDHVLIAHHPDAQDEDAYNKYVGHISWFGDDGEIAGVSVHDDWQRRGVATELFRRAREIQPEVHHAPPEMRTPHGERWIRSLGSYGDYLRDGGLDEVRQRLYEQPQHHVGDEWRTPEYPGTVGWVKTEEMRRLRHHDGTSNGRSPAVTEALTEGFKNGEGWIRPLQLNYAAEDHRAWLGEGNHRLEAAHRAGEQYVPVTIAHVRSGDLPSHYRPATFPRKVQTYQQMKGLRGQSGDTIHPRHVLPDEWLHPTSQQRASKEGTLAAPTRTERLYGAGDLDALFNGNPTTAVPFPRAARSIKRMDYDKNLVNEVLRNPEHHHMQDVDPRLLHATQPSVTRAGVSHYLSDHYERTGETYADMDNAGNRRPIVYHRVDDDQYILLSGHHRGTAKLLRGEPLQAIVIHGPWGPPRGKG